MKEISDPEDIKLLVDRFYEKVIVDESIGYFFKDVVRLDWQVHIPVMYNFWESILLGGSQYKGNPMVKHIELSKKEKLKPEHFIRWLDLWEKTIRENFSGTKAEEAINRARQIAELMKFKIEQAGI